MLGWFLGAAARQTLRKWSLRYQEHGVEGLCSQSRIPHGFPKTRVWLVHKSWILGLRNEQNLVARRIQSELFREHESLLSLATIHKMLTRHEVSSVNRPRKKSSDSVRYKRFIPGDLVQINTTNIAPGTYQFTSERILEAYFQKGLALCKLEDRKTDL